MAYDLYKYSGDGVYTYGTLPTRSVVAHNEEVALIVKKLTSYARPKHGEIESVRAPLRYAVPSQFDSVE